MGNKRAILDHVVKTIMKVHDKKKIFCDLMGGTNSVGYAIKTLDNTNIGVVSNDSESYSFVIANALITNNDIQTVNYEKIVDLLPHYYENYKAINKKWSDKQILERQHRSSKSGKGKFTKNPFCLFTFYYADVYFSLNQCKEIDSIRYAIQKIKDKTLKNIFLTSLIYATSYGSSSFGHFAQPRKVTKEVLKLRKKSILELFISKLTALEIKKNEKENYVFNSNYKNLLSNKKFKDLSDNIGTIYLDPPYSPANYSRFYHVLNTLIRYDHPANEFKGLYRNDRFLSDFCKSTKVKDEFTRVIKYAHKIKSNLVISYSNTGLLDKNEIKDLCKKSYTKKRSVWSEKEIHHLHSTQGNRKKNGVKEILIICKY